jgi:hypothetical protein
MQNRNKLLELFAGNLANAVLHRFLEKAIDDEDIASRYLKEINNSWEISKRYREKINPLDRSLPHEDIKLLRNKIIQKVKAEVQIRITYGYQNLNLGLIEELVEEALKELKVM